MSIEASNEKVGTPMDSFCKTCTGFGFVQVYYAGRVVRVYCSCEAGDRVIAKIKEGLSNPESPNYKWTRITDLK